MHPETQSRRRPRPRGPGGSEEGWGSEAAARRVDRRGRVMEWGVEDSGHQQSGERIYMHHMQINRLLCFCIYFAYICI